MAHLHDGADMTSALDVLGTQLPRTWRETYDKVLEQGQQGGPEGTAPLLHVFALLVPLLLPYWM